MDLDFIKNLNALDLDLNFLKVVPSHKLKFKANLKWNSVLIRSNHRDLYLDLNIAAFGFEHPISSSKVHS